MGEDVLGGYKYVTMNFTFTLIFIELHLFILGFSISQASLKSAAFWIMWYARLSPGMGEYVMNQHKVNKDLPSNLELSGHPTAKYNGPIQRKTWEAEQSMEGSTMELRMARKGACHKTVPNSGGASPPGPPHSCIPPGWYPATLYHGEEEWSD